MRWLLLPFIYVVSFIFSLLFLGTGVLISVVLAGVASWLFLKLTR